MISNIKLHLISHLNLTNNPVKFKGFVVLANQLVRRTNSLVQLNVASTGLNAAGMRELSLALRENKSVIDLRLGTEQGCSYRN